MPGLATLRRGAVMAEGAASSSGPVSGLQEAIHNLLNVREQGEFREIINDYQSRKNLVDFCHSLSILLDTPAKRQISKLLKKIIPKSHATHFDQLMAQHYSNGIGNALLWESKTLPRQLPGSYATVGRTRTGGGGTSVVSAPAYGTSTLPTRGAKVIRKPMPNTDFLDTGRSSAAEWAPTKSQQTKWIHMVAPSNPNVGLGFSIRGGAEHGIGIYVSYVDVGSTAERHGLTPGDLILSVNGVSFRKITHDEAARIVKTARKLDLEVRNVGRVPGSFETHQTYTWVDAGGRPVSPPPEVDRAGRYETSGARKSGLMLLKDSDERKVNLVISETKTLGISIRGGNEFGLGIYVTQVDPGSVAQNAGLQIGDQVLDVNGYSFLDTTHADAVKVLKSARHLMITVKDVGKLPYARTTHDHTQWITGQRLHPAGGAPHSVSGELRSDSQHVMAPFSNSHPSESMFSRGAGSQLMHHSMMHHTAQTALLDEKLRRLLQEREHLTVKYYLEEYHKGYISVQALTTALFEVLNTRLKFGLFSDIRDVIFPKDIQMFDTLVLQREVNVLKSKSMDNLLALSDHHDNQTDVTSFSSNGHYGSPLRMGRQGSPQYKGKPGQSPATASEEEMEALRHAIQLIEGDRRKEGKDTKRKNKLKAALGSLRRKKKTPENKIQVSAEVHRNPGVSQLLVKDEMRSPSEDSGVDLNGASHATDSTTLSSNQRRTEVYHGQNGQNGDALNDSLTSFHSNHYRLGGPNAYSLMDTAIQRESDDQDGLLSSMSEFDESLHRKMDMFKTLPAQFESEMVHANIQTEDDWSHVHGRFGGPEPSHRGRSGARSKVPSEARSHSLDRHKLRHRDHLSPRTRDIILTAPSPWMDRDEDQFDVPVNRPPKPPRTQSTKRREENAHTLDIKPSDHSFEQMSPAIYDTNSPLHIPDIKLDNHRGVHVSSSHSNSSPSRSASPYKQSIPEAWSITSHPITEPLSIVPPPPTLTSQASDAHIMGSKFKLFDIPLDASSDYMTNGIPPPSETFEGRDLSPIAIAPPPPPMDSPLQLSPDVHVHKQITHSRHTADRQAATIAQPLPYGLQGEVKRLRIPKSRPNLGIAIEGGANTRQPLPRIINIQSSGAASLCRDLKVGHVIFKVNDHSLEGLEHKQCARTIALAFKDREKEIIELTVIDTSKKMAL